jgi:ABC-type uncharacterized transport system involved in gliding motility auxiliary subunit
VEGIEMKIKDFKPHVNLILIFVAVAMLSFTLHDLVGGALKLRTTVFALVALTIGIYFLVVYRKTVLEVLSYRWIRYSLNLVLLVAVMLAIFIFVYLLALNNDTQIDTTSNARFSLSEQTIKVLKNLKDDVNVLGFYGTYQKRYTMGRQHMDDLLEQYTLHGGKFSYKLYNINKEPEIAEQHKVSVPGTLIVKSAQKEEVVTELSEDKITNAIIRISRSSEKKIYFLSGHGERSVDATDGSGVYYLNQQLKNMNYQIETLKLSLTGGVVPDDCDLLIIPGLRADLFPIELKGIFDYIKKGGNLYVMLDPGTAPRAVTDFDKLGVKIGGNIIVMNSANDLDFVLGNIYTPITNNYGNSEITRDFNLDTVYDKARSVETAAKMPEGVKGSVLVSTNEAAHSETLTINAIQGTMKRSGKMEKEGPVSLGVALEIDLKKWIQPKINLDEPEKSRLKTETIGLEKPSSTDKALVSQTDPSNETGKDKARVVIMGDSEFAMDYVFGSRRGNYDFILNTVAWLTSEEDLISIRPPHLQGTPIFLSDAQAKNILWVNIIIAPIAVLILGFIILRSRKHRYIKNRKV